MARCIGKLADASREMITRNEIKKNETLKIIIKEKLKELCQERTLMEDERVKFSRERKKWGKRGRELMETFSFRSWEKLEARYNSENKQ